MKLMNCIIIKNVGKIFIKYCNCFIFILKNLKIIINIVLLIQW